MAGKSNIEWTGHTWNPLAGCTVLTPGCKRCYAMKLAARLERMGQGLYAGLTKPSKAGPVWTGVMRQASEHVLLAPLKRKKPTTYFVNSMSDLFHEGVPDYWIDAIFAVMALCPQHTFQVLTKRAARMKDYFRRPELYASILEFADNSLRRQMPHLSAIGIGNPASSPLRNVWLGVSTERQQEADERIPLLLETPAAIRFISAEPLLGPIDLTRIMRQGSGGDDWTYCDNALTGFRAHKNGGSNGPRLDWIIVGGESGPGARPMHPEWATFLRDQCRAVGMLDRFFFKQWGAFRPVGWVHADSRGQMVRRDGHICRDRSELGASGNYEMDQVGKKRAGRLLDGIEHNGTPRLAA